MLWDNFRLHICDDLDHHLRRTGFEHPTEEDVFDYGLFLLNVILQESGRSLQDFEMHTPRRDWSSAGDNPLVAEQLDYDQAEERERAHANFERKPRAEKCVQQGG
jgi:hypothetical protein